MAKNRKELEALDPTTTDVFQSGPIDRYLVRRQEHKHLCLADFVASYSWHKTADSWVLQSRSRPLIIRFDKYT